MYLYQERKSSSEDICVKTNLKYFIKMHGGVYFLLIKIDTEDICLYLTVL